MPLWLVITGLGITQIIGWGTTYYALGALSQDIEATTGWSKALIFGAFSAALLLSGLISTWAGRFIDRNGGRNMMMAGSVLAAMGCGLIGLIQHPAAYVAGWLVLGIAMRFATYDAAFASLAQIAGAGARRAISYLTLFGGLASTVFWPVSHWLSVSIGWPNAMLSYAALHIIVCLPIHALVLKDAQGEKAAETQAEDTVVPLQGIDRRKAMAWFAAALALNGIVFSSISAHVVPLFDGLGFRGDEAVAMAALIGPSQVASRIGEILLGRKLKAVHLGLIAFGLLPVALAIFWAGGFSWVSALVFAVLYGASNGLVTIAKGAVPLVLFGRRGYGEVLGLISTPNLIVNAAAPLAFALLLSGTSPQAALMIAGAAAIASGLCMARLTWLHPR
ncbi:MFS transporter [Aestuariivirga sp.]|uniref:MFS transporter n=1 Tax=Aestuariivirga sp. TaxID=2650926 RepID=UPI00359379D5